MPNNISFSKLHFGFLLLQASASAYSAFFHNPGHLLYFLSGEMHFSSSVSSSKICSKLANVSNHLKTIQAEQSTTYISSSRFVHI